jgi:tol-pal system protein YbgF
MHHRKPSPVVDRGPSMRSARRRHAIRLSLLVGVAMIPLLSTAVMAQEPALEARIERLERMLNNESLADLLLQVQRMQQDLQELRGMVEMHQYELEGLRSGRRLGSLGGRGDSAAALGQPDVSAAGRPLPSTDMSLRPTMPGEDAENAIDADALPGPPAAPPGATTSLSAATADQPDSGSGLLELPSPETTAGSEREAYREAFDLLKARDYDAARNAFNGLVVSFPRGQFTDKARYWLGEIAYISRDYETALAQFNRLMTDFPTSPKIPAALLKVGYIYHDQNDPEKARTILSQVITRFPETTEGRLAKGRLDRITREDGG